METALHTRRFDLRKRVCKYDTNAIWQFLNVGVHGELCAQKERKVGIGHVIFAKGTWKEMRASGENEGHENFCLFPKGVTNCL